MENIKKTAKLKKLLKEILPKSQIYDKYIDRFAKGTDAGFYRLIPQLVVQVNNETEISEVLKLTHKLNIPVVFKAAGTSLSGQTITDSVLIEIGPDFDKIRIEQNGKIISMQPGIRGGFINMQLAKYGYKLGPSPASISSAKIGGIVANNASGASHGITTNSYNTIQAMRLVFNDGTVLVTNDPDSVASFKQTHAKLIDKIVDVKQKILSTPDVFNKIKDKYRIKNTTGYGMNSFLDFDDPIDIITHLMAGSEGTLAFMSEITLKTFKDPALKSCSLIFLPDIKEAAKAIMPLRECDVSAAELMDRNALHAVEDVDGMPAILKELPAKAAALLVETSAETKEELEAQKDQIKEKLKNISTLKDIEFTDNVNDYNTYWSVRKGLFTSAAATRDAGTACIIEDVAFPGAVLDKALPELQSLLDEHGYNGSVMWGHLLDGNIHFLIMPDFKQKEQVEIYKSFMHKLTALVVNKFHGSLKAEHGTGRNMAPFVEFEWGTDIYNLMKDVKNAFDPQNLLNPGVLINDDPEVYTKNIKQLPTVHPVIDKCIECGFCEPTCPSRDITLTPRQRITVYREMISGMGGSSSSQLKKLKKDYEYKGIESCATDGLCELSCPVGINTGKLVKDLRFEKKNPFSFKVAKFIANNFGFFTSLARRALNTVYILQTILPEKVMQSGSLLLHRLSGRAIPLWNRNMPKGAPAIDITEQKKGSLNVVYFPTCINRMFGTDKDTKDKKTVTEITKQLLEKAGYNIIYPENLKNLCCGMAFDSKGFKQQGMLKLKELEAALLKASNQGEYPVLSDMSPCLLRMKDLMDKKLNLYEPITFTLDFLTDKLVFNKKEQTVVVHVTCSSTKMGLDNKLVELAKLCVTDVVKPEKVGCCGWAGDKGFSLPALNKSALRYLKDEVPENAVAGYSTSRTCEIGLSLHSGLNYQSILYLVDEVAIIPKNS